MEFKYLKALASKAQIKSQMIKILANKSSKSTKPLSKSKTEIF